MTLLDTPAPTVPAPATPVPQWRARVVAVCLALIAVAFLQDPGRIAADTKLDLTVNPWGFLGRALHLWDPEGFFGQLQNQAYGYLWPMGPFFGIGHSLGLPAWVIQRLWWSLILVAAFLGMYLLLRALRVGHGWPQILAGLAYALAVRPQSALGAISVEVWPMAVAPWVLLPLVRASLRGNVAKAAALSALATTTAGGVNAVAAGAVLPLAAWWLLTRTPGPRRRRLLAWWSGLTALAVVWWLIPLVVLGKYSPPFLDWIESSEFTTSITSPINVLRGADHWLAYLGPASLWTSGWMLATYPLLITATGVVAAAGLAGLAMPDLPHRAFLVGGAVAGTVLVGAGHAGVMSGLGSEQIQLFLDGAGAPLRNVHKFDLLLRIPLTVGFCHVLTRVWPLRRRPHWRLVVTAGLVGALVVTWWPTLAGNVTRDRSYVALADHWREASYWLNNVAEPGRALIIPGSSFGQYVWARTQDEPLQALGGYPWGVRDAVPLSSAGNIRMLDAIENRLSAGQGSKGLSSYLERMGVRYLVVRNDLDPATGAPAPIRVHQTLDDSPGIQRVAWFGPIVDIPAVGQRITDEGQRVSYPAVEIFSVTPSNAAPDLRAALRPADDTWAVDGSPEALLWMADAGMLGNRPTVLQDDSAGGAVNVSGGVVTDTDRRREITFGYMRDNESATMTADQPYVQRRPVHDYRVTGEAGTTVAMPTGMSFQTSSASSDVDAVWRQPRGATPLAAMDGALDTYWRPGSLDEQESFWEVRYDSPVNVDSTLSLALLDRGNRNGGTIPLIITTDNGTTRVDAQNDADWQTVPVVPGKTSSVRIAVPIRLQAVSQFGLREVRLPGEGTVSVLGMPSGKAGDAVLLTSRPGESGPCVPRDDLFICSDGLELFSEDRTGLFREVDLATNVIGDPTLVVAPRDATTVAQQLQDIAGVHVTASSQRTTAVAGSARAAFDRRIGTAWQAAPNDPAPQLTIELPERRTVRGIRLVNRSGLNASSPLEVRVQVGGDVYTGYTDFRGLFRFDPVATKRLKLTFLSANAVRSRSQLGEYLLPMGVSEIGLIGADDLRQPLPADALVTMPCGSGPDIEVDGSVVSTTSVTGRVDQFESGSTLPATACSSPVTLPAGSHAVTVRSSKSWRPVLAAFADDSVTAATGRPESPEVLDWSATQRTLRLSAHEAPQVLELAENYNAGWQAHITDQQLQPVRVDGWKQAFLVPAGLAGDVQVDFAPDPVYRGGLLAGLLALLVVVWVAVRPPRIAPAPALSDRRIPRLMATVVGFGVLLTLGPWGLLASGAALLGLRKANSRRLAVIAFGGVAIAVLAAAAASLRPAAPIVVLQGCALALAWVAVALAGLRDDGTATAASDGRTVAPDAQ